MWRIKNIFCIVIIETMTFKTSESEKKFLLAVLSVCQSVRCCQVNIQFRADCQLRVTRTLWLQSSLLCISRVIIRNFVSILKIIAHHLKWMHIVSVWHLQFTAFSELKSKKNYILLRRTSFINVLKYKCGLSLMCSVFLWWVGGTIHNFIITAV